MPSDLLKNPDCFWKKRSGVKIGHPTSQESQKNHKTGIIVPWKKS